MRREPPISEASMQAGESRIPQLAAQAGKAAHERALVETGAVVMRSAGGQLIELRSSGAVRVIKSLPASTPVRSGTVLRRTKKPAATTESR